jgi:LmbE family N-acetylglucosaminyl deacetylase
VKKTIAAIMAHADDIEFSAGATFARRIAAGAKGLYGVLSRCNSGWTRTEQGGFYVPSRTIIPRRRQEAEAAARIFGAELYYGDLLENCYTTTSGARIAPGFRRPENTEGGPMESGMPAEELPEGSLFLTAAGAGASWGGHPAIRALVDLLVRLEPELVIGQPFGDMNPDHFLAAQIVAIAWRKASEVADIGPYWLPVIPAPRDTQAFPPLTPNRFIDVSGYEATCLEAVACHVSQGGHLPEKQEGRRADWAAWKGMCGLDSAEAFIEIYPRRSAGA